MDKIARVKRLADLFIEGEVLVLGYEPDNTPILLWVSKLNSFDEEDARRDATVARSTRMALISAEDSPERKGIQGEMAGWNDEQLAGEIVNFRSDEIFLRVLNDLDADEEIRELRERVERMPELLEDEAAPPDDQRRTQILEDQKTWTDAIQARQQKLVREAKEDVLGEGRERMEEVFLELWRDRTTIDAFINEKRISTVYRAMRTCVATNVATSTELGAAEWSHDECNHQDFFLEQRADVRKLSDEVVEKVLTKLGEITVGARAAGN